MINRIDCKDCDSPSCKGCNIYILATALNSRELDSCIDESGTIRTNLMPVVLCKDCIYRDPEDKKCDCGCWHFPFTTKDEDFCSYGKLFTDVKKAIIYARWIESGDHVICSNCGTSEYSSNRKYCHNCGAAMRG